MRSEQLQELRLTRLNRGVFQELVRGLLTNCKNAAGPDLKSTPANAERIKQVIIAQPAAHFRHSLAAHAELTRAPAWVSHRQHENLVAFAARAFRAAFGMSDRALQQRATQQLAGDLQFADQFLARSKGLLTNHSQK
jgi:hypothetical protein